MLKQMRGRARGGKDDPRATALAFAALAFMFSLPILYGWYWDRYWREFVGPLPLSQQEECKRTGGTYSVHHRHGISHPDCAK